MKKPACASKRDRCVRTRDFTASTSMSRFEAHVGLFRLLIKGKFDAFDKKYFFELVTRRTRVNTRDSI